MNLSLMIDGIHCIDLYVIFKEERCLLGFELVLLLETLSSAI